MASRIAIIQGHPDPQGGHLCNALAEAYAQGAKSGGHHVDLITVATLEFPLLRTQEDYEHGTPPESIAQSQQIISTADHLVFVYPLWAGSMPALLKGFIEQAFRPGFAIDTTTDKLPKKLLKGKSARIIVTMGMPAFVYRWFFRAHSLKSLERNILSMCGVGPIKASLFGMVDSVSKGERGKWLQNMTKLGALAK